MMRSSKLFFAQVLLIFNIILAHSAQAEFTYGYTFKPKRNKIRIPFELRNNLMIIKLMINESDTLNFILDSGIKFTMITDPKTASAIKLDYVRKIDIFGFGIEEPLSASVAVNNKIDLSGVLGLSQSIVALSNDALSLSNYVGMPIHGLLGYDLFGSFVIKIDYIKKIITLVDPKKYKYNKRDGKKIPISIEHGKPYITAQTTMPKGNSLPLKLVIDTGAGHGLLLERSQNPNIELPEETIYHQLGKGLNGVFFGNEGRIPGIKLGDYELTQVIASFPDTNTNAAKMALTTGRQGNLGCEILRRFDIVFNYRENYMVLKPNKRNYNQPFERDMVGFMLKINGNNFNRYIVDAVTIGSPAYYAGIEKGDELVTVNNKMIKDISLGWIQSAFQKGEGKKILLCVKRAGQFHVVELQLKRMI